MGRPALIDVSELRVVYNKGTPAESTALNGVTFTIEQGEFVVIFGPSGCGKSTLLYALNGIERHIEGGTILVDGRAVERAGSRDLLAMHRKDIGMIFQAYNLLPTLTVLQNVAFPLIASGVSERIRDQLAHDLLERFGIAGLATRFPRQLSGGQQQRVAIARSLIHDPSIIMADEPTGNLDSQSAEVVTASLLELCHEDKKTIVLVTHDPSFLAYAHRVIRLKDGEITSIETQQPLRGVRQLERSSHNMVSPFDQPIEEQFTEDERQQVSFIPAFLVYWDFQDSIYAERVKNIIAQLVLGKMARKDCIRYLTMSTHDGGLGFSRTTVIQFLFDLEEAVAMRAYLRSVEFLTTKNPQAVVHVANWMKEDVSFGFSTLLSERLEQIVSKTLSGETTLSEVETLLHEHKQPTGIGLQLQQAQKMARKLGILV